MANVIIIGGGKSQLPFVNAARDFGYRTVVFDGNPAAPGAGIADFFYPVSTHSIDTILGICAGLAEPIQGVVAYSAHPNPLTAAALLSERYQLPCFSMTSLEYCIDKSATNAKLGQAGIPTPQGCRVTQSSEVDCFLASHSPPYVVKPATGCSGSLGVSVVPSYSAIYETVKNAIAVSTDGSARIECFVQGKEYSFNGIVQHGQTKLTMLFEKKILRSGDRMLPSRFVSLGNCDDAEALDHDKKRVVSAALEAIAALGFDNTFFSLDIIYGNQGPVVIECGVMLDAKVDRLLYFAGIDVYSLAVRLAIGEPISSRSSGLSKNHALSFLYAKNSGELYINHNVCSQLNAQETMLIEWEKQPHDMVAPPLSLSDALGWIITAGDNQGDMTAGINSISGHTLFSVK